MSATENKFIFDGRLYETAENGVETRLMSDEEESLWQLLRR